MSPAETKKNSAIENKINPEYDVPHHRISIELDGQEVGYAEMLYFSEPTRFYYITYVEVQPGCRGKKLGSRIVESVNKFLDNKKLPGVLIDFIEPEDKAAGIYERHGWQITNFDDFMVYSPRSVLSVKKIGEMVDRINKWYNRPNRSE